MAEDDKKLSKVEREDAARQRADYARALREELEAVKAQGKKERASAIEAELKRIGEKPTDRQGAPRQTAAQKRAATKAEKEAAAAAREASSTPTTEADASKDAED